METGDSWRSAAGVHGVVQGGSWKLRGGGSITVNDAGVEVSVAIPPICILIDLIFSFRFPAVEKLPA